MPHGLGWAGRSGQCPTGLPHLPKCLSHLSSQVVHHKPAFTHSPPPATHGALPRCTLTRQRKTHATLLCPLTPRNPHPPLTRLPAPLSPPQENIRRNFGMPQPNGYRKAMRFMRHADKFGLPIITFVDTPGAYAGKTAEELGQVGCDGAGRGGMGQGSEQSN